MEHLKGTSPHFSGGLSCGRESTMIPHGAEGACSIRFVNDFYRPDLGVISFGEKESRSLPCRWMQTWNSRTTGRKAQALPEKYRSPAAAGRIAGNIEDSTPCTHAACFWNQRTEERFEEWSLTV